MILMLYVPRKTLSCYQWFRFTRNLDLFACLNVNKFFTFLYVSVLIFICLLSLSIWSYPWQSYHYFVPVLVPYEVVSHIIYKTIYNTVLEKPSLKDFFTSARTILTLNLIGILIYYIQWFVALQRVKTV